MPVATPVISASNLPRQLSDGNDQGTTFGLGTTPTQGVGDLIGFFGKVAAQQSGNAQAAITRGQACGLIMSFTSPASPSLVQAQTTAASTITPMGATGAIPINTGDLIYVNKPTSQAGLGVGNARASGVDAVSVTFSNNTGTSITPTASEAYSLVAIRGFNTLSVTLSPAAVQANTTTEQLFTATGVRVGEVVQVNKPSTQAGLDIAGARVSANNQIGITFMNNTGTTITPTAAEAYTVFSMGGLDAVNNEIQFQITASPTSIQANTMTEFAMPVTGLLLGDAVKGVSKPSVQAGLGIVGMRVSVPSTIGVLFFNNTGTTITPTAGEVYEIALTRANPVAPVLNYSQALTPVAVAPLSTVEQTFTVTGLIASSPVWVNKPSAQAGLGIVGQRVSAASTLALNFVNLTTATITPTAAEVYLIANFQDPQQTGGVFSVSNGNSLNKSAAGAQQQDVILTNALRAALGPAAHGLIVGA